MSSTSVPAGQSSGGFWSDVRLVVYAVALGLAAGTTATVARRIGEKHPEAASQAAFQAILLGIGVSLIVGVAGIIWGNQLLRLMGASPEIIRAGGRYTVFMLGGVGTIFLLFLINAVFRGAGDPIMAMRTLWLANLLNILLNPCLIFGLGPFPRLGVLGSATPIYINLVCYWAFQLPLAWWLSHGAGFGPKGVYISIAAGESLLAVVASLLFRRGKWKLKRV